MKFGIKHQSFNFELSKDWYWKMKRIEKKKNRTFVIGIN